MPVSLHQQATSVSTALHSTSTRAFCSSQKVQDPHSRPLSKLPQVNCLHPSRCLKTRQCQQHYITMRQRGTSMAIMHQFDTCQKRTWFIRPSLTQLPPPTVSRCLVGTRQPSRFGMVMETMSPSLILWCSLGHSSSGSIIGMTWTRQKKVSRKPRSQWKGQRCSLEYHGQAH